MYFFEPRDFGGAFFSPERAASHSDQKGHQLPAFSSAWGVSAFVMGYLADKVGRRAVLVPAILVFSLMSAASGLGGCGGWMLCVGWVTPGSA